TQEKGADDKSTDTAVRFGLAALASIPLSPLLAWLLNIPLRNVRSLCSSLLFRISSVSELEGFLWDATSRSLSVMITMDNGKVYIGNAIEAPKPGEKKTWIRLEPLLSGFRNKDTHKLEIATSYFWIHRDAGKGHISVEDFDVLLPIDGIHSVHPFDLELWAA